MLALLSIIMHSARCRPLLCAALLLLLLLALMLDLRASSAYSMVNLPAEVSRKCSQDLFSVSHRYWVAGLLVLFTAPVLSVVGTFVLFVLIVQSDCLDPAQNW